MNAHVIRAIFRRNFISYFNNPTGYVFICVFTLLTGLAAFWTDQFWNANLANLDQLNGWLPFIMLLFVPAITMSIWADERRQGTDELLLTIPATDFDVVMGKFLAAISIFAVGLFFSLVCNLLVLCGLGSPDVGQFLSAYVGYFLIGVMMISIGMVASFLTANLTVSFVLGALLNAPLVLLVWMPQTSPVLSTLNHWSVAERFQDFGRGVISLSGLSYFLLITIGMFYLCMVMLGRRHWLGGRDGHSLVGHYLVRSLALAVLIVAAISFFHDHDFARVDVSSERLSSLSPETVKLIQNLDAKRPVRVDAYVSTADEVPESYITTRLNLLNALKEFESIGGNKLSINVHDVNRFSDDVGRAERQFGIKPETVESHNRGLRDPDAKVMLGLAFTCGTDPAVIVPFVGKSLPVEYEIARSIATVSQTKRKQVGVLTTDVRLFGTPDMMTGASQNQMLIDELKKQYDVVQVDPAKPITERYDVLLAAQPSSLSPEAMHNFIEAVKRGQPTAIFEDPFPVFFNGVPGTNQPKQPPGGMMGMQQPPAPKGNIQPLWDLLEVDFNGGNVICQDYFPSPKWASLIRSTQFGNVEWVFASPGEGNPDAFNPNEPITSGLSMVLFPFAGSIQHRNKAERTKFTPLVATGDKTGIVDQTKILMPSNPFMMSGPQINPNLLNQVKPQNLRYQLAAKLTGTADMTPPLNPKMSDKDFQDAASPATVPTAAPRNGAGAAPANADEKASDEKKADEKKTDEKTANGDKAASEKAAASKEAATDNQATPNKEPAPKAGSDQGSEKAGGEKAGSDKGGEKAGSEKAGSEKAGSEKEKTPDHGVTDKTASGKSKSGAAAPDKEASKPPVSTDLNVVVVADVDVLASAFFGLRLRGEEFMDDVKPDADNVIFVLNTIDELAAETRFLDIRKRRKVYRTLQKIDTLVSDSEQQLAKKREEDLNKVEDAVKQYNKAMRAKVEELQKQSNVSDRELNDQIRQYEKVEQDRIAVKLEKAKKESEQKLDEIRKSQANDIRRVQMGYKFWSIILPPLLPLCLAAIVFFRRRSEEREGVSRARLK